MSAPLRICCLKCAAQHPAIRYVDLIVLDIPGHFYGKRYPIDMLEKVAAGAPLKLPQNCVLLGTQGGLYPIGDYCFADGDPDAVRRLVPGTLKPVRWERTDRPDADHLTAPPDRSSSSHGKCWPACCSALPGVGYARWWRSSWSFTCSTARWTTACRVTRVTLPAATQTTSRTCTSSASRAFLGVAKWSMAPMSKACRRT